MSSRAQGARGPARPPVRPSLPKSIPAPAFKFETSLRKVPSAKRGAACARLNAGRSNPWAFPTTAKEHLERCPRPGDGRASESRATRRVAPLPCQGPPRPRRSTLREDEAMQENRSDNAPRHVVIMGGAMDSACTSMLRMRSLGHPEPNPPLHTIACRASKGKRLLNATGPRKPAAAPDHSSASDLDAQVLAWDGLVVNAPPVVGKKGEGKSCP